MLSRLFQRKHTPKVFVIGLDCAAPELVFDRYRDDLPNLSRLASAGSYGELESTVPAITVPAWCSMFSGRDPGELGFYGFRNRADYSYDRMTIATAAAVTSPRVWDIAGDAGKQVIVVGVPQTYPVRPVNGLLVGCFLTPSTDSDYTWPAELKGEIAHVVGDYAVDVKNFRTNDKDDLLRQIYGMTEKRCQLVKYLLRTKPWDLFMFVEIGVDRIHHGMWKYCDPAHPKHEPGNRYQDAMRNYYAYLDREIGEMLALLPEDTSVVVLSDHGAKAMVGGFCFNQWLIREGYLTLKDGGAPGISELQTGAIDWSRTRAWGAGGYYGRLFLNVAGREPQGTIPASDYEAFRDALAARLTALTDPEGKPMGTRVFKPEETYVRTNGIPPDLIVYFGDLAWRSVGTVGYDDVYSFENDTGPDDANHSQYGMYIATGGRRRPAGAPRRAHWRAVAPTILEGLGITPPVWMEPGGRL